MLLVSQCYGDNTSYIVRRCMLPDTVTVSTQHNPSIITQHVLPTVNKETEPSKGQHITMESEARKVEEQHST